VGEELEPRVVAIGDSLIYGRGDAVAGGWVSLLRRWLEAEGPARTAVFNLGIGGETSAGILGRIAAECERRTPNAVIIGLGANDLARPGPDGPCAVPIDDFSENITRCVATVSRLGARALLAGVIPVDESRTRPHNDLFYSNDDAREYDQALRAVAQREGAGHVPLAAAVALADPREHRWQGDPELFSDGIHPNTAGYAAMYRLARASLAAVFNLQA